MSSEPASSEAATGAAAAAAAAAPAETKKVGAGSRTNIEVWHIRHGERCDEVKGAERQAWKRSRRYKRGGWFDPYLTSYGHVQASRAGLYLNGLFFSQAQQHPGSFDIIYTSPLVRAVQTAVCVSKGLGNLPLQVVPGLCSCTAALTQIGYRSAHATLMTDEDIVKTFPTVNLVLRDQLAPTSFGGAAAWLADKASEKKPSDGDGNRCSRVLAVGHREGTKAMAGRKVPTPHCCIGIFRVKTSDVSSTYELHDLLSHTGESLKPAGEASSYARLTRAAVGEGDSHGDDGDAGAVEALAAQVMAMTIAEARPESSHADSRRPGQDPRARQNDGAEANSTRSGTSTRGAITGRSAASGSARPAGRGDRISSSTTVGLVQRLRRASSSLPSPAPTGKQPAARHGVSGLQEGSRKTTGADSVARDPFLRRAETDDTGGTTSKGGGRATEPPPPRANEAGARESGAAASTTPRRVIGGACGLGFRAAVRHPSRRSSVGGGSTYAGLLGVPVEMLCGASGVLSFLSPTELCMAQTTCKTVAIAAVSESLWSELYSRLPKDLRDRSGNPVLDQVETPPGAANPRIHAKVLFASALSTASSTHAAKVARNVAVLFSKFAHIFNLRRCVNATRAVVKVRVNGAPVNAVQTMGTRTEAWFSRSNILGEPSVNGNDGTRKFALSSSLKVEVLASFETVEALRSVRVALSWCKDKDAAFLLPIPVIRIDDSPFLAQARLLGKSADNALELYDVTGNSRRVNAGRITAPPAPVLRGCVLVGVLPPHRHENGRNSNAGTGGVGFLTVHLPHDLLLHVATRRPMRRKIRDQPEDPSGPGDVLPGFNAALGLRTAGVPLWERASACVDGRLHPPRNGVAGRQHLLKHGKPAAAVVSIDLLRHGNSEYFAFAGGPPATVISVSERTVSASPGLPYSTSGGLRGIVEDVLLADFTLCDPDRAPLWAFTSPIVFEKRLTGRATEAGGGESDPARDDDDVTIDMAYREVREERRCGIVSEPGVGRVVIHLALVEAPSDDDVTTEHVWMVLSAYAELELDFVGACFGTKHGSAPRNAST